MYKHAAFCLNSGNEDNTEQVGRKPGPGMVVDSQHSSVKIAMHFVAILRRNMQIVIDEIHLDAELLKFFGNNPNVVKACILNCNVTLRHCGKANKRSHFDHVRQHTVFRTPQVVYTFYPQQVTPDSVNLCPHSIEHLAKLLNVRFTSCVVNGCLTNGHHCSHDQICRSRNRGLIHQQKGPLKVGSQQMKKAILSMIVEISAKPFKIHNMSI